MSRSTIQAIFLLALLAGVVLVKVLISRTGQVLEQRVQQSAEEKAQRPAQ